MNKIHLRVFSHNYCVRIHKSNKIAQAVLNKFSYIFNEYEWNKTGGSWIKEFARRYCVVPNEHIDDDHLEYRFHINTIDYFRKILTKENLNDKVDCIIEPLYESHIVKIRIKKDFKPFEEQVPIYEQLVNPKPNIKMLGLQTGKGKSALSIFAASHYGLMTVLIMKPGYIDKWVEDINKQCIVKDGDILTIIGSKELMYMVNTISDNKNKPQFVLISNATLRNWLKAQEEIGPNELVPGYPCHPWELCQHCGFGFRIIDEVHQDFHANFRFDLYTHIEQSLSLSATLITNNTFHERMYNLAYPDTSKIKIPEHNKYIRSIAWFYSVKKPDYLRTTEYGRDGYSHTAFEKSIFKFVPLQKDYLDMTYQVMRKTYLIHRKPKEKCLIYFSTVKACELATNYYRKKMPELKITKFNQGDSLEDALKSDIIVATLMKAGTAIDIPNLTTVILTIAIDSIQSNLQSMGRLRDLKKLYDSDRIPDFVYFVCNDVKKHWNYHKSKEQILKEKARLMTEMNHTHALGK